MQRRNLQPDNQFLIGLHLNPKRQSKVQSYRHRPPNGRPTNEDPIKFCAISGTPEKEKVVQTPIFNDSKSTTTIIDYIFILFVIRLNR